MDEFSTKIPEDIRKKYVERRARDVEVLSAALERSDFDILGSMGHQLKGNGATFGYEMLADLGRRMEDAAESRSLKDAKECLFSLKAWVQEQKFGVGEDG